MDLPNTQSEGVSLSSDHLCDVLIPDFSQEFAFHLICLPPRVFEVSEIKLGQDTY